MDESRRNFILGMTTTYAALSVSVIAGTGMIVKNLDKVPKLKSINTSEWEFSSYDVFSPALIGSAMSAIILNNIEYLYSLIIILMTLFLLFTIGIPGYEYLLPYSEQYFISG